MNDRLKKCDKLEENRKVSETEVNGTSTKV